jgi:hypothetical protein|tara:strand:- start:7963 stop:8337 length:375 start_codon:yes stop_codon:yes gene_type:complete
MTPEERARKALYGDTIITAGGDTSVYHIAKAIREAEAAAYERAAKWHDDQLRRCNTLAAGLEKEGEFEALEHMLGSVTAHHVSAAAIRLMGSSPNTPYRGPQSARPTAASRDIARLHRGDVGLR